MKNVTVIASATAATPVTPAELCPKTLPAFVLPTCCFAAAASCRICDHYSSQWCYRHKTWTDPDKWPCSEFR